MASKPTPKPKAKQKTWDEMSKQEKAIGVIGMIAIPLLLIWFISSIVNSSHKTDVADTKQPEQAVVQEQPKTVEQPKATEKVDPKPATKPKYNIAYLTPTARFDKKTTYYVVIDPVDTSNDSFKQTIKDIVSDIAKEKKTVDFTATIYDNTTLASDDFNHVLATSDSEQANKSQHTIAMYNGGIDPNTAGTSSDDSAYIIAYYPAADKSTAIVGKYVATVQY